MEVRIYVMLLASLLTHCQETKRWLPSFKVRLTIMSPHESQTSHPDSPISWYCERARRIQEGDVEATLRHSGHELRMRQDGEYVAQVSPLEVRVRRKARGVFYSRRTVTLYWMKGTHRPLVQALRADVVIGIASRTVPHRSRPSSSTGAANIV